MILREALRRPLPSLPEHVHLTPGVPVRPMLAKPTKGIAEVLERFGSGSFTCEYKYDGERAQVHRLPDGSFKIFSRNSEDMTGKYPDVLGRLPKALLEGTVSFILDCEAVAYDVDSAKLLPFQQLSTRAKKNVTAEQVKVQVKLFAFDCLFLNGTPLLKRPLAERRAALYAAFREVDGEFGFATASNSDNAEEIADFLNDAVNGACEGLMVKTLDTDATYEPSRRSLNWLKVKKDYLEGMGDSLDLVPIGAYHGRGKRTGVYGAYLLACYDPEREEYQSICKIGTGFSEEALGALAAFFKEEGRTLPAPRAYYRYPAKPDLVPDVWFDACTVRAQRAPACMRQRAQEAGRGLQGGPLRLWPRALSLAAWRCELLSLPLTTLACPPVPYPTRAPSAPLPPRSPRPPHCAPGSRLSTAAGVGGARGGPLHLAAALRGRGRRRRDEGHRAALSALHPHARRQEARGRDRLCAGRANVPRPVHAQAEGQAGGGGGGRGRGQRGRARRCGRGGIRRARALSGGLGPAQGSSLTERAQKSPRAALLAVSRFMHDRHADDTNAHECRRRSMTALPLLRAYRAS